MLPRFILLRTLRPGGYSKKNWVGVCGPLAKTLALFMTKIYNIPFLLMTRQLHKTLSQTCVIISSLV